MTGIHVGFVVPTGEEVSIDPQHLGITGLTQQSGKTTALEALASRMGLVVFVFRTGRGEVGFHGAHRTEPFLRPRVDWRYVEGLVSAQLQEKARFYRGDIILACRGAKTIAEVHRNVNERLGKSKNPWTQKVLVELNEYLTEVEDALKSHRFADHVEFEAGVNLVDLEKYTPAVQQLVIASMVDWVMTKENTVVVLPEARDFIPEDRSTPAKLAIEGLVRKGAKLGNYLWLDSQALTGLDMNICRSIGTWFFGRQTLDLEVHRVMKMVPGRKVHADDVHGLSLGEFLLVSGEDVVKVYVQPAWLSEDAAMGVARGEFPVGEFKHFGDEYRSKNVDEEERARYEEAIRVTGQQVKARDEVIDNLQAMVADLRERITILQSDRSERSVNVKDEPSVQTSVSREAEPETRSDVPENTLSRALKDVTDLHVSHDAPNLTVHVQTRRIDKTTEDSEGRLGYLIQQGFFDAPKTTNAARTEFQTRGWGKWSGGGGQMNMLKLLQKFVGWEYLKNDGAGGFALAEGAKKRLKRVNEEQ